jgi:hypothetical protein
MATQEAANSGVPDQEPEKRARYVRVKVVDTTKDGRPAVNIHVPIGVVKWGMKMAQTFSPDVKAANLDWDSITAMIQDGARGEIVHVDDEAQHKTIDVWVE